MVNVRENQERKEIPIEKKAFQFVKYINRVYRFQQFLKSLSDRRINPSIPKYEADAIIFSGLVAGMTSFNQIEEKMGDGYFDNIIGRAVKRGSADTLGYVQEHSSALEYRRYNNSIVRKARYNKTYQGGTIDGFLTMALDGTELTRTESEQRSCRLCKKTEHSFGDAKSVVQRHENFLGVSYVGKPPNLVVDIERVAPGEGESTAALRLLDRLRFQQYYYAEVCALDSLYASAPVINKLLEHNVIGVIRVKQEHYNLVKDAEGLFKNRPPDLNRKAVNIKSSWYESDTAGKKYRYNIKIWDEEGFTTWDKVKAPLRLLKVEECKADNLGRPIEETQVRYIIVTAGKDTILTETVWRILHRRWDIENKTFHDLKKYWSFGHDFHHEENAFLVMRWMIVIAYNLFMLFFYRYLRFNLNHYTHKGLIFWMGCILHIVEIPILDSS